ncbi:MAG: hypothetical protein KF855_05665 [Acidobacteria bacterium]|nr:hypothetical protein [Acidobacteriota bacterium]
MKKIVLFTLMLSVAAIFVPTVHANAAETSVTAGQIWQQRQTRGRNDRRRDDRYDRNRRVNDRYNRGRNDRYRNNSRYNNTRVRYETRMVRRGNKLYRETYRVWWDNGRMKRKRVDRVRIR